jgi:phosphoglycolate phosphatase
MSKYKAIIWDMDGTLLNTLDDLTDSVNAALTEFRLPVRTRDEIQRFVGNGIMKLVERSVPDGKEQAKFEEIFSFFKNHYDKNCRNKTKPYDGLEKVLPELKAQGYRMAIVSNKIDSAVKELAESYFGETIDTAIGETEGKRSKPYPDMVFEAMRILDVKTEESVYIGDSEVDLKTAENSGLDCISVSWGFRSKQELQTFGAKTIIDTPEELAEFLKR